jgi:AMIN domain-containing protein
MRAVQKNIGAVLLLLSYAAAQNTATVQRVTSARDGRDLRVEITLSSPVKPSVETAENPSRIVLDFPETSFNADTRNVPIHSNGVLRVRTGQHSATPLVTRVVVDLDQEHPYVVNAEGSRIILTVGAVQKVHSVSHGAPAAASSGNIIGIFRRSRETKVPTAPDTSAEDFPPPAPASTSGTAFEPPVEKQVSIPPAPAQPSSNLPSSPAQAPSTAASGTPSFDQNQIAKAAPPPTEVTPTAASTVAAPAPGITAPPAAGVKSEEPPSISTTAPTSAEPAPTEAPSADPAKPEVAASGPATSTLIARTDDPSLRTVFKVKYVAEGVAYLEGGRAQGLAEGMKLYIEDSGLPAKQGDSVQAADPRVVAELEIAAVAETSSVTDIHTPKRAVKVGDLAYLSAGDAEALVQKRALSATRQYPAVISFTEGDTLDEEARQEVPRPPPPSVNRARGRFGFDAIETFSHGASSVNSSNVGMVFRGDITRIGGTYWNLSGYWRGELTKASAASQQTLQNLINRTYHLNMTYDNPNSALVAGFGRLYLPWAPSLDTIDGGYFGKKLARGTTLGIFGGSTPDPSSWDYSPNRVISGGFVNFEGGEYNGFHYTATSGAGISMVNWAIDRPFVFVEDSVSYKRTVALYESAQFDSPRGNTVTAAPGPGLGRNFTTFRVNPHPRLELDVNYNYFRDIPTFDTTLLGTGLLDKYLFQGFSAGGRVEVWNQIWLSTNLGRSSGTGDAKSSLNEMFGVTFNRLPVLKLRADAHYSRFNSSFGNGSYESFSLSRQVSEQLRLEVLVGQQNFASTLTTSNRSRFVTGTIETTLGSHYYLQSNFTSNRGNMSYDQMMLSIGYRFDNRRKGE